MKHFKLKSCGGQFKLKLQISQKLQKLQKIDSFTKIIFVGTADFMGIVLATFYGMIKFQERLLGGALQNSWPVNWRYKKRFRKFAVSFYFLSDCFIANYEPLTKKQPHRPDVNYCIIFNST